MPKSLLDEDGEFNVEGTVARFLVYTPFEDREACLEMARQYSEGVARNLRERETRLKKRDQSASERRASERRARDDA